MRATRGATGRAGPARGAAAPEADVRAARAGDGATARRIMWQPRRSWLVLSLVRAKLTVSDEAMLSILRGSWIAGGAAVRETATQRRLYLTWARQLQLQKAERRRPLT